MLKIWFPNIKPSHQTTAVELTQEEALLKKPKVTCLLLWFTCVLYVFLNRTLG